MPTVEQKAVALEKAIDKAEFDLGRTKHAHAWTSDRDLKRIKPENHAAHVEKLKKKVADLYDDYRKLEDGTRNGGRRTRRRHRTRSTRRR